MNIKCQRLFLTWWHVFHQCFLLSMSNWKRIMINVHLLLVRINDHSQQYHDSNHTNHVNSPWVGLCSENLQVQYTGVYPKVSSVKSCCGLTQQDTDRSWPVSLWQWEMYTSSLACFHYKNNGKVWFCMDLSLLNRMCVRYSDQLLVNDKVGEMFFCLYSCWRIIICI